MKNTKELYKEMLFKMKKEEIIEVFSYLKDPELESLDELDLRSRAMSYIDRTLETMMEALRYRFLEAMEKLAEKYRNENRKEDLDRVLTVIMKIGGRKFGVHNTMDYLLNKIIDDDFADSEPLLEEVFVLAQRNKMVNSDFAKLFYIYTTCLFNLDKNEKQAEICGQILKDTEKRKPTKFIKMIRMQAYIGIGNALLRLSRVEEAFGYLMKGHMLDPGDKLINLGLAKYYDAAGNYERIKGICREIIKSDPENPEAWFRLGMAHIFSGEKEEGRRYLIKAYRYEPDEPCVKTNLLQCLYELGKLRVPTNCNECDYYDELVESGEADRVIKKEIEGNEIDKMRDKLEQMIFADK